MAYCALADLEKFGLPKTSFGKLTDLQKQGCIDSQAAVMDTFFRGRYALPFLAYGIELTECNAVLAAYACVVLRGFNPANESDLAISGRASEKRAWLQDVQRKAAHPDVTPSGGQSPTYDMPLVITGSVVDGNGRTATTRGW